MQDLTKMSDEDLVNTVFGEFFSCRVPLSTQVAWSSEILRRLSLARIDGKAVSCPSGASLGSVRGKPSPELVEYWRPILDAYRGYNSRQEWSARDEACLRVGGAD